MEAGTYVVVDLGKTVAKVSLWSKAGRCLQKVTRTNETPVAAPYRPLDMAATADWLVQVLAQFSAHPVEAIIPVAHGAAVAGIRQGALAFASPDYEWDMPAADLAAYRAQRDPFALTGSPALPAGLNFGAQLHMLEALGSFEGVTLLPYAQYWAWLLSGTAVSEVTSLGCHSDLWCPAAADFSPMARARGWASRFAPMARAGDVVGRLRPELAARTGLSPQVRIHAGLHDSNAALLAVRGFAEIAGQEATVLSTGTWFIAMRSPAGPADLAALPEDRDCLVNVDAFGQPVPSARLMGGREVELLGERIDRAGTNGLADVLLAGGMALPSQVPGCGPFPTCTARWVDRPGDAAERGAAVALYAALMTDAALDLIGSSERLVIEGRFAASELFTRALASLRPGTQVWTASGEADVSFGALRLIDPALVPVEALSPVAPLDRSLDPYRDHWYDALEAFA
ncbi:MAG: carbohydrate kinase [Sphingomonadales bacterium]|nr:carbohydrate kinase [Sphingomonadales bacterium]